MQPTRRTSFHGQMTQPVRVRPLPPSAQPTVPFQPVRRPMPTAGAPPSGSRLPLAAPRPAPGRLPARPPAKRRRELLLVVAIGVAALVVMSCAAVTLGLGLVYAGGILPGVRAGGISLGGLSQPEAAAALQARWQTITLRDSDRSWLVNPAELGISLDAATTAKAAYEQGRAHLTTALAGIVGQVDVPPVVIINPAAAEVGLRELAPQLNQPAINAGVRLANGQVEATPPVAGRALDVAATLAQLQGGSGAALADGVFDVVMQPVQPAVTDATPMLEQVRPLLASPFEFRVFDPVTGDSAYWSLPPELWGNWLSAEPDGSSPTGLALSLAVQPVRDYLQTQSGAVLDDSRYLKLDEAAADARNAVASGRTHAYARVYHHDAHHLVQSGETIISIAWDYGVPYPYIQQANGGIENVSAGQTITVPSPDNFMPFPVNPDKRIVVSISQQRAWIYENGALKWEWPVSTGISSSPTWPGIYQIISHEANAYAGNWNLWMPNFMGVYKPIPGSDFTNGFHGFPTRGGSQLLWTNSLGTRVTYGCILLSNDNVQQLYPWAEEGVVVEIQA